MIVNVNVAKRFLCYPVYVQTGESNIEFTKINRFKISKQQLFLLFTLLNQMYIR